MLENTPTHLPHSIYKAMLFICMVFNYLIASPNCTNPKKENIQNWPQEASSYTLEKTLHLHSMKLKRGVQLEGISPLWLRYLNDISHALPDLPITWVSGIEGQSHRSNPETHYDGTHLDLRIKDWPMVNIENKIIVEGYELVDEALKNLNKIKGLQASLFEGLEYPFIEIQIIEPEQVCDSQ